jgi:hypothetical protein
VSVMRAMSSGKMLPAFRRSTLPCASNFKPGDWGGKLYTGTLDYMTSHSRGPESKVRSVFFRQELLSPGLNWHQSAMNTK